MHAQRPTSAICRSFSIQNSSSRRLAQRVDAAAEQNRVSRNAEIITRLEESFRRDPIIGVAADVKRLVKLQGGA
jgi:hypothetical protein